jgi:flagellar export protein FliJ
VPGKFRFRLQPVLEMRERAEQEKQLRVAALDRERIVIEESLRACQQSIDDARLDLRSRLAGARGGGLVIIPEVRAQAGASVHMEAKARQTAIELAGAYKRLERARQELAKAAAARRAVDLLKERRFEEWRQAGLRADAALVDEAGTQQFIRERRMNQGNEQ